MSRNLPLKVLHVYGVFSLIAFLVVEVLKSMSVAAPEWMFYYLNDFLVIPMVGIVCLHGVWLIKNDRTIRLNAFTVFSLVMMYSVFFEYYLPQQSGRYTADVFDVVCYVLGGVVFVILQKLE